MRSRGKKPHVRRASPGVKSKATADLENACQRLSGWMTHTHTVRRHDEPVERFIEAWIRYSNAVQANCNPDDLDALDAWEKHKNRDGD